MIPRGPSSTTKSGRSRGRPRKTNTSTTAEVVDEREEGATGETDQEPAEVTPQLVHGLAGHRASGKSVIPGKASGKKRDIRATTVREKNSSQPEEKIDRLILIKRVKMTRKKRL